MLCCDYRALPHSSKALHLQGSLYAPFNGNFCNAGWCLHIIFGRQWSNLCLLTSCSFSQFDYSIRCMFPKWSDWQIQYTRKGLLKERIRQGLSLAIFAAMIVGLYQARRLPGGISALPSMLRQHFKGLILGLLSSVSRGISRVQRSM